MPAVVSIVMGSDSDLRTMSRAGEVLASLGVGTETRVISAHREPDAFFEYARAAESRGIKVIIAGAGLAAHLPGMTAALCTLPVIGVPLSAPAMGAADSLLSIVQMPPGVPVATVGVDAAVNAGLLAARILALGDEALRERLIEYSRIQREKIEIKDARLQEIGVQAYLDERG